MRILLLLCSMLLASASVTMAQHTARVTAAKTPNLSGVWIPQVEKDAKPDAGPSGWTNVIIEQHEAELKFTLIYPNPDGKTKRKAEFTYYTDGRGETNNGTVYYFLISNNRLPNEAVKSATKWEGNALVIVHRMASQQGQVTVNSDLIMRWELSADGKTLVRTTKSANFSAVYKSPSGELKNLNVSAGGTANDEFKDNYILLEAKH